MVIQISFLSGIFYSFDIETLNLLSPEGAIFE